MAGAYMGFAKEPAMEFPLHADAIPRPIPDQPWFLGLAPTIVLGGILPFGACFVELFFILSSMWMDQYYYVFGFTLLVFVILIVTCAEITIVLVYFQLCAEDYHWWWRSFLAAGSTAIYVFLYSALYFSKAPPPPPPLHTYPCLFYWRYLISCIRRTAARFSDAVY